MNYIDKIKKYYLMGIYKEKHIERLVECNIITNKEYSEIIALKEAERPWRRQT